MDTSCRQPIVITVSTVLDQPGTVFPEMLETMMKTPYRHATSRPSAPIAVIARSGNCEKRMILIAASS